jgi:hypothetical protein
LSSQLPGHVAWCASLILFSFLQDLLWTSLQFWCKLCESCGTRCVLPHCCFQNVKWQSYNLHWESWQCGCEISKEVSLVDTIDKSNPLDCLRTWVDQVNKFVIRSKTVGMCWEICLRYMGDVQLMQW